MRKYVISVFAVAISMISSVSTADEVGLKVAASCGAMAYLVTGEFPETVKVYQDGKDPSSEEEAIRAYQGAIWTNRSVASMEIYRAISNNTSKKRTSRSEARNEWVTIFYNSDEATQNALFNNCEVFWSRIDNKCEANPRQCLIDLSQ